MPDGLRDLLRELFSEHLAYLLGCTLDVEALVRVVVMAHSGGYQAAASALRYGGLPGITEVDLLDAFYGADGIFEDWVGRAVDCDDPRLRSSTSTLRLAARSLVREPSRPWPTQEQAASST